MSEFMKEMFGESNEQESVNESQWSVEWEGDPQADDIKYYRKEYGVKLKKKSNKSFQGMYMWKVVGPEKAVKNFNAEVMYGEGEPVKESIEQIDEAKMSIDSDNYKVTVDYDEDKGATFKVGSKVVAELKGTGNMKATIKDPVLLLDALMDIINSK